MVPCIAEGLFPIIANASAQIFPPIFYLAVSLLLASAVLCLLVILTTGMPVISKQVWVYSSLIAIFIFTGFSLIFLGTRLTSSINTALLLQTEMLFTFVLSTFILRERLLPIQLAGAVCVLAGTGYILYNGSMQLNSGDMLIIAATAMFPMGNVFAKKALALASPMIVLMLRYIIGGSVLLVLSLLLEDLSPLQGREVLDNWWLIPAYVFIVLTLSKVVWYKGLSMLPLGKAIYIVLSYPAFSLLFAFLLLHEVPTWYQLGGFAFTMFGVYLLVKRPTVAPHTT